MSGAKRMKCVGGPKDGQTIMIKHGSRFLDVSTDAVYIRDGDVWRYVGQRDGKF